MLQSFEQGLQINGKTRRGIARAITAQQMIVSSTAAETIAQVGGETLKGNTGIVMKATDIAQIDEYPVFQTVRFQHIIHLGEIRQSSLGTAALAQIGGPVQDFGFAKQRGNLQQHLTSMLRNGTLGNQRFQRRSVLFLQSGLNVLTLLLTEPGFGKNTATKFELADRQAKILQPTLLHTFNGDRNHFGIRLWRVQANEFDPGLIQFLEIARL